jgi:hypothetical protein
MKLYREEEDRHRFEAGIEKVRDQPDESENQNFL